MRIDPEFPRRPGGVTAARSCASGRLRLGAMLLALFFCFAGGASAVTVVPSGDGGFTPPYVYGVGGGGSFDLGSEIRLQVSTMAVDASYSYEWRHDGNLIAGATGASYVIAQATAADAGTYTVVVSAADVSSTGSARVEVLGPRAPQIYFSPYPPTAFVGADVTFFVGVTGTLPRTCQWQKDGVDIPGATSETFTIQAVKMTDVGSYTAVVRNAEGSATSVPAALSVNAAVPIELYASIPADVVSTLGNPASLTGTPTAGSYPMSYQWYKEGAAIAGAMQAQLIFSALTYADAGHYFLRITNAAGTVQTRTATVDVKTPTPLALTSQLSPQAVFQGAGFSFSVMVSGNGPLTYEWRHNGVLIPGATNSGYGVAAAALADAGDYTVRVTGPVNSVVSGPATLTVTPAIAPTVAVTPESVTVPYFSTITLTPSISGSAPLTYDWARDGVSVPLDYRISNLLRIYNATPANNGRYTFTAKNIAGTAVSAAVPVTVLPAVVPTITAPPTAQAVPLGKNAHFAIAFTTVGTGPVTVQWLKNGAPLAGATAQSFDLVGVKAADAADYAVQLTGVAGTVTSSVAHLTVLAAEPPAVAWFPSYAIARVDGGAHLGITGPTGSPPFSYQWYRDGVAIAGATSTSFDPKVSHADLFSEYSVTVSNTVGIVSSPAMRLVYASYQPGPETPWLDSGRQANVAYFLLAAPARIERFDLAAEQWLPTVYLGETRVPTAFAVAPEGVYIAYGTTLVRRGLDLSGETPLANAASAISHILVVGDYVYYTNAASYAGNYSSVHRQTLQRGPETLGGAGGYVFTRTAVSPTERVFFARRSNYTPTDIEKVTIQPDGTFGQLMDSPFHGDFEPATLPYVFPAGDRVTDNSGIVYRTSDLTFAGTFGQHFTDLTFLADGRPVVLRAQTVSLVDPKSLLETGRVTLSRPALRLYADGDRAFAFGPGNGTAPPSAEKVPANFAAEATPAVTPTEPMSIDDAWLGPDGIVHVFSRSQRAVLRWSAVTHSSLTPIPLRRIPSAIGYQPGAKRVLLGYADSRVTELSLSANASGEHALANVPNQPFWLLDLDGLIRAQVDCGQGTGSLAVVADGGGAIRYLGRLASWGEPVLWATNSRRLYSYGSYSNDLEYCEVPASGVLPEPIYQNPLRISGVSEPFRFNAEQTLILTGEGSLLNADLQKVGALANGMADGAWLPSSIVTIRAADDATEVQRWARLDYRLQGSVRLAGRPVRVFRLTERQVVVVTNQLGTPLYYVLNDDLTNAPAAPLDVAIGEQPGAQAATVGGSAVFAASLLGGTGAATAQWMRDGVALPEATAGTLSLSQVQPAQAGLYAATFTDGSRTLTTAPAALGISSNAKVTGDGAEVGRNIVHANGNIYDQILLQGSAAAITADPGEVVRLSFVDLTDDIVQVEFSGAGTLSIVLDAATGPASAAHYLQPDVRYMKGHAGLVITGADESTNVSVFSVGRATAVNQALFRDDVSYDASADLAYLAIASRNGRFGGVRLGNVNFYATRGVTGLYAPEVRFTGPVYVGDVHASGAAQAMLVAGDAPELDITGGDCLQLNGQPVHVHGVGRLKFAAGTNSQGKLQPAQAPAARFEDGGADVTNAILVR